uniref:AIG1-type G domain-containing protein n=1 Tax=Biomphalaria glabrata TaxID=6526 RepID=A0A2C9M8A2_BIOGL
MPFIYLFKPAAEENIHQHKEKKVILIVGRSGNGKRSIGNSLLGEPPFFETGTYEQTLDLVYKDSDKLRVIVCPFIGDTGDDIDANLQEICDAARKLKYIVGDRDIDAILFVLKYGVRFTKQEKDAVQRVKDVFGPDVFKHHIIIAFSY